MRFAIETLTPERARDLLTRNYSNRPVSKSKVATLMADMVAGVFRSTHQPMLIGKYARLIDGQHRALACVRSGVAVRIPVAYDETIETPRDLPIDTGTTRRSSFVLGVNAAVAATAAYVARVMKGREASAAELRPFVDVIEPILSSIAPLNHKKRYTSSSILAAAVVRVILNQSATDYVSRMLTALMKNDPQALSPRAYGFYRFRAEKKMSDHELFIRALSAFDESTQHVGKTVIRSDEAAWFSASNLIRRAFGDVA